jgi:hypothetical protein
MNEQRQDDYLNLIRSLLDSPWGLGIAYQNANQFPKAYNTFESAIATIESLREEIVSGEESKRKQAERFNQVYSGMVEVCTELNKIIISQKVFNKSRQLAIALILQTSKNYNECIKQPI